MIINQVLLIEDYLHSIKKKKPEHIKFAKSRLQILKEHTKKRGKELDEDLKDIRILYQAQLASAPTMANYLTIAAIIISLIIGMFSLNSSLGQEIRLFFSIVAPLILLSLVMLVLSNFLINKKSVVYTIIIQLIDEVLEN
ncbi:hypothetical protein [Paenibacillus solani]|uniref:hypothetical protein n=1 Tax=Paenibacillus solani TaxID=1705565 RepID=UPI003D29D4E5